MKATDAQCRNGIDRLKNELEQHLSKVACPVHGLCAREVEVYGDSIYDMRFRVDGCCDDLADAMLESIGNTETV